MKMEIFPEWYGTIGKAIDNSYIGRKLINDFDNSLSASKTAGDILMKSAQYGAHWGNEIPDQLTGGVEGLIYNEYDAVQDKTNPKNLSVVNQTHMYNGCVACAHGHKDTWHDYPGLKGPEDIYRIDGWNTVSEYLHDGVTKNPQYPLPPTPDTALIQITPYQYAIFTSAWKGTSNQKPTDTDYPTTVTAPSNWGPANVALKADIFNSLEKEYMWSDDTTTVDGQWKDGFAFRAKAPIIKYWRDTWNTICLPLLPSPPGYAPNSTNNFNRQWGSKVSGLTLKQASDPTVYSYRKYYVLIPGVADQMFPVSKAAIQSS